MSWVLCWHRGKGWSSAVAGYTLAVTGVPITLVHGEATSEAVLARRKRREFQAAMHKYTAQTSTELLSTADASLMAEAVHVEALVNETPPGGGRCG